MDSGNREGALALHEGTLKGDPVSVRTALKDGAPVDCRNNYGRAPIHWAACKGNTEIMDMLIQAKCDIEARDKYGMRPILMAAWHGQVDAVKMLINYGACVTVVNKKHYGVLTCAARNNRLDTLCFLLDTLEALNLDLRDLNGRSALHHAAAQGHLDIVKKLIDAGASTEVKDKGERTPLHLCCEGGHVAIAEYLLAREGGQISLTVVDKSGSTALHLATENKHCDMVRALLESGANVDAQDEKGLTALHLACRFGCRGITEALLQGGASINKQANNGNTPLHEACIANEVELMDILIGKGSDLNCLNNRHEAAIHLAAEQGRIEACRLLLAAGADLGERGGPGRRSPLYLAARGSFTAIVDMIIQTARLDYPTQEEPQNENKQNGDPPIISSKPVMNTARRKLRSTTDSCEWEASDDILPISVETISSPALGEHFRDILYKLSHKQLQGQEWRRLALHWAFTEDQLKAIEHQYTGPHSYKEHGYRMMLIWAHGLPRGANPIAELCAGLTAIGRSNISDNIKKRLLKRHSQQHEKHNNCSKCSIL